MNPAPSLYSEFKNFKVRGVIKNIRKYFYNV